jgi:hypothetical protein
VFIQWWRWQRPGRKQRQVSFRFPVKSPLTVKPRFLARQFFLIVRLLPEQAAAPPRPAGMIMSGLEAAEALPER